METFNWVGLSVTVRCVMRWAVVVEEQQQGGGVELGFAKDALRESRGLVQSQNSQNGKSLSGRIGGQSLQM